SPDYNNYNSKDSINDSLAVKKEALIKEDSSSPQLFLSKEEDMLADPFILNYLNGKIKKYDVTDKRREQSLQQKQTTINYFESGHKKLSQGEYIESIELFTKEIEKNPHNADAYYARGLAYFELGDYEAAVDNFQKVSELSPSRYDAYVKKGNAEFKLADFDEATKDYNKSNALKPNLEAYMNLAEIKFKHSNYAGAIKDYSEVIDKKLLNSFEVYYKRGLVRNEFGRYKEALEDLNKAIDLYSAYPSSYYQKGLAESRMDRNEEAIRDFTKAIDLNNGDDKESY